MNNENNIIMINIIDNTLIEKLAFLLVRIQPEKTQ